MEGEGEPSTSNRVILHVDMDAFYCQVECRRLNLDPSKPLCVQQWDGLIAVNYPAKALGISRHMRVSEQQQKLKDVRLVHVETIGLDGAVVDERGSGYHPKRSEQKACLERYRRANLEILEVLHAELPTAIVEKASIDEFYIDVTTIVDKELEHIGVEQDAELFSWSSVVVGDVPLHARDVSSLRLSTGAKLAARIRGAIHTTCGFTSSAGIAHNKMLAKVGSALNKPNRQTIIHTAAVPTLMEQLPLRRLGRLGGKLGEELEHLIFHDMGSRSNQLNASEDVVRVSDVLKIAPSKLVAVLGRERADFVLQLARGQDESPVVEKERTKSMLAAKSFEQTSDLETIKRWISVLSVELEGRMRTDLAAYQRRPKTLALTFRSTKARREMSRRSAMPRFPGPGGEPCRHVLAEAGMALFKSARASDESSVFPCVRLALTAQDFVDCPNERLSIKRFFSHGEAAPNASVNTAAERCSNTKGEEDRKRPVLAGDTGAVHTADETEATAGTGAGVTGRLGEKTVNHALDDVLAGVDVEEQAKLLKEASMLHRMTCAQRTQSSRSDKRITKGQRRAPPPKKQKTFASFFAKKQVQ